MLGFSRLLAGLFRGLVAEVIAKSVMPGHEYRPGWRRHANRKRLRAGHCYPHSSTRQRARYARQMAAGKLNIAVVTPPEPVKQPAKAKTRSRRKTANAA